MNRRPSDLEGTDPYHLRRLRFVLVVALMMMGVFAFACDSDTSPADPGLDPPPPQPGEIHLGPVASGLSRPLDLTAPPGDARLFVVEQTGTIRIIRDDVLLSTPFLDLGDLTVGQGERGLLGLAFHPEYALNGRFFVNFTDLGGDTRIVEYQADPDADQADPTSSVELHRISQPFGNHNGGHLAFGPDGMLYVGVGDGGGGGDPHGHGQNVMTELGGLLRLDVDDPGRARIPSDNPFAGRPAEGREELWAWGLRNPWRFSFDFTDGLLYIADVGQNRWEEVNVVPADSAQVNYGWAIVEGTECFGASNCDRTGLRDPVVTYRTGSEGCSVIGGYVYRGSRIPHLQGAYLYSDYCAGWLRSFRFDGGTAADPREWPVDSVGRVLSLGEDAQGELYLLTQNGGVYRIDPGEG